MATRWGVAGAGKIAHDFITAVRTLLPESEHQFVAVAARDLSRAKEFAGDHGMAGAYGSYGELAADRNVEVVYIATVTTTHLEIGKMMLNAGKHVLCEKPLTQNLKQAEELIALAKRKKLFFMEAIWSRCFPVYDTLRKELADKSIGEVKQVIVGLGQDLRANRRLTKMETGGGMTLDLGVYPIQFACLVFDHERPTDIRAVGHLNEEGVDLSMSASLTFENGGTATIVAQGQCQLPNEAYVIGTEGTIHLTNFWCSTKITTPERAQEVTLPEPKDKLYCFNSVGLGYEAAEVRDCIKRGLTESPKMTHAHSLLIAEIEDEIRRQIGVVYEADEK